MVSDQENWSLNNSDIKPGTKIRRINTLCGHLVCQTSKTKKWYPDPNLFFLDTNFTVELNRMFNAINRNTETFSTNRPHVNTNCVAENSLSTGSFSPTYLCIIAFIIIIKNILHELNTRHETKTGNRWMQSGQLGETEIKSWPWKTQLRESCHDINHAWYQESIMQRQNCNTKHTKLLGVDVWLVSCSLTPCRKVMKGPEEWIKGPRVTMKTQRWRGGH